ncbi:MAG: hypothetical protein SFX73_26020 [Kofleriaceae bacterium]|nr:hypothetical protein [Kofleriaceae bacterium]
MKLGVVVVCLLAALGCTKSSDAPPRAARGTERGDCRPAVDKGGLGTCDPGLLCLSNLCVRPPPADCQKVADHVASIELGNYAEPEARAPVVTKLKAACEKAFVSKEQGDCVEKATDKWAAMQCAPTMFPEMKSTNDGMCGQVMARVKALIEKQMGPSADANATKMVGSMMEVMRQSCEQDGWPDELKKCIVQSSDDDAMAACNSQMPPAIQQKIADRMQKAMMESMPQTPPMPTP